MADSQRNKRNIRFTLIGIVVFVAMTLAGFIHKINQPRILNVHELRANGAVLLDTPRKFSEFEFTDHRGQPFGLQELTGKWSLLFFGFTHCPDICPTTMAAAAKMYEGLDSEEKAELQVVLVSLDPERDTTAKLAQYVPYFNPDFIGATGNQYVLLKLATELNVAFSKVPLENGDYTIDHGANMVLVNPYGHYHGFFKPPFAEESMRMALRSIMATFDQ
ncbi:MAG: SCO family protein [Porticoccus sp.]|nr:SCO family protein [Porticoccus sp.]